MSTFEFQHRLIPDVSSSIEWLYLVNETYIGEACIVPLLEEIYDTCDAGPAFRKMIGRQLEEEEEHVERYRELLCQKPLRGSGYDVEFAAYVRALPCLTLKIYALQALLEGISLGALRYRAAALVENPHAALDQRILDDELRHTQFAHGFFKQLIAADGLVAPATFDRVARDVNGVFARHFNGAKIAAFLSAELGLSGVTAESIDQSAGKKKFFWKSTTSIVASKNQFVERYYGRRGALSAA